MKSGKKNMKKTTAPKRLNIELEKHWHIYQIHKDFYVSISKEILAEILLNT